MVPWSPLQLDAVAVGAAATSATFTAEAQQCLVLWQQGGAGWTAQGWSAPQQVASSWVYHGFDFNFASTCRALFKGCCYTQQAPCHVCWLPLPLLLQRCVCAGPVPSSCSVQQRLLMWWLVLYRRRHGGARGT